MGYFAETGYSLPGADEPLTHARILHAGNRARMKTLTASATASASYPASAADNALTAERWRPFANAVTSARDFSTADWTAFGVTIGSDGQTIAETTDNSTHRIQEAFVWNAVEEIAAFKVERQTLPEVQIFATDGTTDFTCFFDLRDGTVGTAANCTGQIVDLGGGVYLIAIRFTPLASGGTLQLRGSNGSEATTYVGDTSNTIRVLEAYAHDSAATLRMDTFADFEADLFCIAGHNFGSGGVRITFEHDSNDDGTFTTIDSVSPTDDSPIMFLFAPITSSRWRITVDRGVVPELAVLRVGKALQLQRSIHQNVRPMEGNRQTAVRGNLSDGGEWVGRSTIRTGLQGSLELVHLTKTWVDANLYGRDGMIQALEREPAFIAWRPGTYDDAHYVWTNGPAQGPVFNQSPNLMSFSLPLIGYGYE